MNVDVLVVAERLGIPFAVIIVFSWFGVRYAWPFVVDRTKKADEALIIAQNSLVSAHDRLIDMIKDQTEVNIETVACLAKISERLKHVENKQDTILEVLKDIVGMSYSKEVDVEKSDKE